MKTKLSTSLQETNPFALSVLIVLLVFGTFAAASAQTISIQPATLDFDSVIVGQTDSLTSFIINTGTQNLVIDSVTAPNGFGYGLDTSTVAPGDSALLTVSFSPFADSSFFGSVYVFSNDSVSSIDSVVVTGFGLVPPDIGATPSTLNFDSVAVGDSLSLSLFISNNINNNQRYLIVDSVVTPAGFSISNFPPSHTAGGDSTEYIVTFKPPTDTTFSDSLFIYSNDPDNNPFAVAVNGIGVLSPPILRLEPDTLVVDSVLVGTSDSSLVTVYNDGGEDLIISNVSVMITPPFSLGAISDSTVAGGDSTSFYVIFSPDIDTTAFYHAGLSIVSNGGNKQIPTIGVGILAPPILRVEPDTVKVDSTLVGSSDSTLVTIYNDGGEDLVINWLSEFILEFSVGSFLDSTIAGGDSTSFYVIFSPVTDTTSFYPQGLEIGSNAGNLNIALTGVGILPPGPILTFTPSSLQFDSVQVGVRDTMHVFLNKFGAPDLIIDSISAPIGFDVTDFFEFPLAFPDTNLSGIGGIITVGFTPPSDTTFSGAILFYSNTATSPDTIFVNGVGVIGPPDIRVEPLAFVFDSTKVGESDTAFVQVFNDGQSDLILANHFILQDFLKNSFSIGTVNDSTVLPGDSTFVELIFTPISAGLDTGTVLIGANDPDAQTPFGSGVLVDIEGVGLKPIIKVDPAFLNFDSVLVGTTDSLSSFITNDGNTDLIINFVSSAVGGFPNHILSNDTIAPGDTALLTITFSPLSDTTYVDRFNIFSNDVSNSPDSVNVQGFGLIPPTIRLEPNALNFDSVTVGNTDTLNYTLFNDGTQILITDSVVAPTGFTTNLPGGFAILGGDSTQFWVTFTPFTDTTFADSLFIFSNDPVTDPAALALSGIGVDSPVPTAPTGLNGIQVGADVELSWNKNPESDISFYTVYRNSDSIGVTFGSDTTFTDIAPSVGLHSYQVSTTDIDFNQSARSGSIVVNVVGAGGEITVIWQHGPDFGKDAFIRQDPPNVNYGVSNNMVTTSSFTDKRHMLMQFDSLQFIPSDAVITNASLILSEFTGAATEPDSLISVHRILESWDEGTGNNTNGLVVDWQSAKVGVPWTTPGGTIDSSAYFTRPIGVLVGGDTSKFDITNLVQEWVSGTSPNYGMMIRMTNEEIPIEIGTAYYTSDDTVASRRPKLIVKYTTDSVAVAPAAPIGLNGFQVNETVQLNWTANTEPDLAGYIVYRGTDSIGTAPPADTSFIDLSPANGNNTYQISAFNTSGLESVKSAPVTINVIGAGEEIKVVWQPGEDVAKDGAHRSSSGTQDLNYGAGLTLVVSTSIDTAETWHSLIQFDSLQYIPANALITEASLSLTKVFYGTPFGAWIDRPISFYRITKDWAEGNGSATPGFSNWLFADDGVPWDTPGGDFAPETYGTRVIDELNYSVGDSLVFRGNLKNLLQGWVNGSYDNFGMLMKYEDTERPYKHFTFASSTDPNASWRPKLEFSYILIDSLIVPAKPTGLTAVQNGENVDLSWNANSEPELSHYIVYRDADSIGVVFAPGTTFTDVGPTPGTYTYQVSAVSRQGLESNLSDGVGINVVSVGSEITVVWQHGSDFGKDGLIRQTPPKVNYGATTSMVTTSGLITKRHILIEFDSVQFIPSNAVITEAQLILTEGEAVTTAPDSLISVHKILQSWVEGDGDATNDVVVDWESAEPGVPWQTPGGTISPFQYDTRPIGDLVDGDTTSFAITNLVQEWVSGVSPNYGLMIKVTNEDVPFEFGARYYTSDDSIASRRPKLIVKYTIDSLAIAPATPIGLNGFQVNETVKLNWIANTEPDLAGYIVYRGPDSIGTAPPADTSFIDPSPVNGNNTYQISAFNTSGLESAKSDSVTVFVVGVGGTKIFVSRTGNDVTGDGSPTFPYLTISKAAEVANPGDSIKVELGIYEENVTIDKDNIVLQGVHPDSVTIVSPFGGTTVSISGEGIVIEKFLIKGGVHAIDVAGKENKIQNNIILNTSNFVGILVFNSPDSAFIVNNIFLNTSLHPNSTSIEILDSSNAVIRKNTFLGDRLNVSPRLGIGITNKISGSANISNNIFQGLGTGVSGGGGASNYVFYNTLFNNSSNYINFPVSSGNGDIHADPQLLARFFLAPSSPSIGVGSNGENIGADPVIDTNNDIGKPEFGLTGHFMTFKGVPDPAFSFFRGISVGQSVDQSLYLTNNTAEPIVLNNVFGSALGAFQIVSPLNSPLTIAPSGSLEVVVRFTPLEARSASNPYDETVIFNDFSKNKFKFSLLGLSNTNIAPSFVTTELEDAFVGNVYTDSLLFEDADSDTVRFELLAGPSWLSIAPAETIVVATDTPILTGTPSFSDIGTDSVAVRVFDFTGLADTLRSTITVIAAGEIPEIFWVGQESDQNKHLYDVFFINKNKGWAVGNTGLIINTIDGGNTWTEQPSSTNQNLFGVYFSDALNGWAVGNAGTILRTSNGGAQWVEQISGSNRHLLDVHFDNTSLGWIVGKNGEILKTIDGGLIWDDKESGTSRHLYAVDFVHPDTGYAVGDRGTIIKTVDGGETWSLQTTNTTTHLRDVDFFTTLKGWVSGNSGKILSTSDGGTTWNIETSGTTRHLNGIAFTDSINGWAFGSSGTILRSSTGGNTWEVQESPTRKTLNAVHFVDANNGWAVGSNGTVIRSLLERPDDLHFTFTSNTGGSYSILVHNIDYSALEVGDEVAVFDDSLVVGASVYEGTFPLDITAWIDDSQTPEKDGFLSGNPMTFKVYDFRLGEELDAQAVYSQGDGNFGTGAFAELTLTVTSTEELTQSIVLNAGWNLISSYLAPNVETIDSVLALTPGNLVIAQNDQGEFFIPGLFNNIGNWNISDAYMLYVENADQLEIAGTEIPLSTSIPLAQGWSFVPNYNQTPTPVSLATASLDTALKIVQNDDGEFYVPDLFDGIGNMIAGEGYQMYLSTFGVLNYGFSGLVKATDIDNTAVAFDQPKREVTHYSFRTNTGSSYSMLINGVNGLGFDLEPGDEVAVFDKDVDGRMFSVGSSVFKGEYPLGLAAWIDDPQTDEQDGYLKDNTMFFRIYDRSEDKEYSGEATYNRNGETFENGTFAIISVLTAVEDVNDNFVPEEYVLRQNYPNPFNPETVIQFDMPEQSDVSLRIYNIRGQLVTTLLSEQLPAGTHSIKWDATNSYGTRVSAGVYIYRLKVGSSFVKVMKMVLIK